MGFTRAQLAACRDATVPDLLGPRVRLLFVGINPGLWTAAAQAHFARRGNRFYPALYRAGIVDRLIDASAGYTESDLAELTGRGIGITNLVARASARADELTSDELVAGGRVLVELVARVRPAVVAVLGVSAYRIAFGHRRAIAGRQERRLGAAQLWVVPNPSGLNAHASLEGLSVAYREAAVAAGVAVYARQLAHTDDGHADLARYHRRIRQG
jgi:TDG/mug DNA glycosylase family protein